MNVLNKCRKGSDNSPLHKTRITSKNEQNCILHGKSNHHQEKNVSNGLHLLVKTILESAKEGRGSHRL